MESLELEKALFVGWSDGACTAMELARTNPSKVVGVVFFACNVDPPGATQSKFVSESLRFSFFEVMKKVGHFAPIQDPNRFNHVVLRYIRKMENMLRP
jgi:pimeloyl-ACP methyl ester carboxylesterase